MHQTPLISRPASSRTYPWYDSQWLHDYTWAKAVIRKVRPTALKDFELAMQVFRTRPDFQVQKLATLFDPATLDQIRHVVSTLKPAELELHEAAKFKRFVVHDNDYFTQLQETLVPWVSAATGESVEVGYNFLSLYGALGVCPLHMDAPQSKWTVDLCLNQSAPWPIYFSQLQAWEVLEAMRWDDANWEHKLKASAELNFQSQLMEPGEALLFGGSGQWHYRDPMPVNSGRSFCDLLFFHFIPQGTSELVRPENWAQLFGIPELAENRSAARAGQP